MGVVGAFTDQIVSPMITAASQLRQLGEVHSEANDHLQKQAQGLTTSFHGLGCSSFLERVHKQGRFVESIVDELNSTAQLFEGTAHAIEDAAHAADIALGGGLLTIAEKVLGDPNISPDNIARDGGSAIHVVIEDIRQNLHKLLDDNGGFFGNLNPFHFHPLAALHDLGHAFGDLIHLAGDIFAMLDSVENILGKWAAEVYTASNQLINQFQSRIFYIEDKVLGFSDMADNAAILSDPNASDIEKAFASFELGATALGDILLFIPGAEESKAAEKGIEESIAVGLRETEKLATDTVTHDLEQQIEAIILHDGERAIVLRMEYSIAQDAENSVEHIEISVIERSLKDDVSTEAEQAITEELEKSDESFVNKLKNIQQISAKIGAGDFLTLHPALRQTLEDCTKQIVDTASTKVLRGIYGEDTAKKLLESEVAKKIQEIAQDKISECFSKVIGKPIKQYLEGQIDESELNKQVRALTNEICQSIQREGNTALLAGRK